MIRTSAPVNDPVLQQAATLGTRRLDGYGAVASQALEETVTGFGLRAFGRAYLDADKPVDYLSAEEANAQFGIEGALAFDRPISEYRAREREAIKRRELERGSIIARSGISTGEILAVSLAASLLDPVGDALALVPYVGTSAKFGQVANTSRKAVSFASRLGRGVSEGAASGLVVEGALYPLAQLESRDYGLEDSVFNIALSGGIGGVGRLIGDALRARNPQGFVEASDIQLKLFPTTDPAMNSLRPETRVEIFNHAVEAVSEGRPVRAGELIARANELGPDVNNDVTNLPTGSSQNNIPERPNSPDATLDPLTPKTQTPETLTSETVTPDSVALESPALISAAREASLLRFYDEDIGGVDVPSQDPSLDRSPLEPFDLDSLARSPEQAELFPEAAVLSPSRVDTGGIDPQLVKATEALEAELKGLVENNRIAQSDAQEIFEAEAPRPPEQVKDLFQAAAFCLRVEGVL